MLATLGYIFLDATIFVFLVNFSFPLARFAAIDSDTPLTPPPQRYVITSNLMLAFLGLAGLVAWQSKSIYAPTFLMMHLGAVLCAAYSDPKHVERRPGETFSKFSVRYLVEQGQRALLGKVVLLMAAVVTPYVAPETWHLPALCAALGFANGKVARCAAKSRILVGASERGQLYSIWQDIGMTAQARAWFLSIPSAIAIYTLGARPEAWSALAGYSLLSGVIAGIKLILGSEQE
ncbi:hypothetical protein GJ698_02875 [Pseudoduganella sp. FT26W]|uniref:Uncharacterized protein n=1 Tax=Duganella aquatilis TaxID=2666082 RepID=A0A844CRW7_9BURK|nr:hypothetical protein [Duganella aquatilis]MRW83033.1 hypothetical protein [Duganella aquatilis]